MTRRQARLLLAASLWTLYVWVTRVFILAGQDASIAFKVAHFALAGISIAFGLAVGWIGLSHLRRLRRVPPNPRRPAATTSAVSGGHPRAPGGERP